MITRNARKVLSLITRLIDGSKETSTNTLDCTVNLHLINLGSNDLEAILPYLRSENLIQYTDSDGIINDISLTEYGRLYPDICKQELKETFLKSIFCPIVVSLLATLITLLVKGII